MTTRSPPRILAIAGSDSSGGAGIQADIKTIAMLGGYAMTAITAATAQNSIGVQAIAPLSGEFVGAQIRSCIDDIGVDAIKIGMLHDADIIAHTAEALHGVVAPIVLDPVMIATSGAALIDPAAIDALRQKLFPLATLITPNLPELAHILGRSLADSSQMADAAEELAAMSGAAVLAKGGHTPDARIIDILYEPGDHARAVSFDHARIDTPHTHGTGCTLSAAIATLIGHGQPLQHAVRLARKFVLAAIKAAPGFGAGNGPLGHHAVRSLD
ncbi:bifunctional hydroxymethylpyrimidine kinase/phosphomethylpyrimidine kinase [Erythrobacter sp. JK5]|uniref:bifunctional hydroxymethylpyrimidine kinase/phosphomethylpyrimidine kinase n=1 Tax=Erythrobacter sp. JK5 TaxID=2829500 RepID=UPI001BA9C8C3|nr:bifunctional hydroxymethylpyrimidine kinase/phosphomethylpyrimidine kinase [Erythrobacter sp. JK5]QUL37787.1 bifunctional hydroxymethylpyrimidine kinase/phosphomethylpyrimidine kinase [Erythrobacter sp. JK5]